MGNSSSSYTEADSYKDGIVKDEYANDKLFFFRGIHIKWVNYIVDSVRKDDSFNNWNLEEHNLISWRKYFSIMMKLQHSIENDKEQQLRTSWHPSTIGFKLVKSTLDDDNDKQKDEDNESDDEEYKVVVEDDHTDDEEDDDDIDKAPDFDENLKKFKIDTNDNISDDNQIELNNDIKNENENENENDDATQDEKKSDKIEKSKTATPVSPRSVLEELVLPPEKKTVTKAIKKPKNWDPTFFNPIFFGYKPYTFEEYDAKEKAEENIRKEAELRAIEKAKSNRSEVIEQFEKQVKTQENVRVKKINNLEEAYNAARKRREDELGRNQRDLPAGAFKLFKKQWDIEYHNAETVYNDEVGSLMKIHKAKTTADQHALFRKREELEAFKDAEAQEMPAAARLEEIARIEISRCVDELDSKGQELEKAREEFHDITVDLAKLYEKAEKQNSKNIQRQIADLKSMLHSAEDAVKQCQDSVQKGITTVCDAEALLDRAVRISRQQNIFLPLFSMLNVDAPIEIAQRNHLNKEKGDSADTLTTTSSNPNDKIVSFRLNLFITALVILMRGTFDQKFNLFFELFDHSGEGFYSSYFIFVVISVFQTTLSRLHMINNFPVQTETMNLVQRMFVNIGLNPVTDKLTQFEMRQLFINLTSCSKEIVDILGINLMAISMDICTYQRNKMSSLAHLYRGLMSPGMVNYNLHYELTKYRNELSAERKQAVHLLALTMGEDDPLKPDYSKFIAQPKKKASTKIEPLYHGHLSNAKYLETIDIGDAATKIQAVFRSRQERKVAELAAKKQAFLDAKNNAIKAMKAKIVNEFKKREAVSGVGKMKWDAQIRMKQAKLRVEGQVLTRNDTVMVMMEEAITKAKGVIEERFLQIEKKEEFAGIQFREKEIVVDDPSKHLDINALFGLTATSTLQDSSAVVENIDNEGKDDDDDDAGDEDDDFVEKKPEETFQITLDADRIKQMIEGSYVRNFSAKGELTTETELRLTMAHPEPDSVSFFNRIRAMHNALTVYRVVGMLGEIPSKRLFLTYIENLSNDELFDELKYHFGIKHHHRDVIRLFKQLLSSDYEKGVLMLDLRRLHEKYNSGLEKLILSNIERSVAEIRLLVKTRLETDENAREDSIIDLEIERINNFVVKYRGNADEILDNINKLKEKYRRMALACTRVEKKKNIYVVYKNERKGIHNDPVISLDERLGWLSRLRNAEKLPETTNREMEIKFSEFRSVCKEFMDTAVSDAMILIAEHYYPKHRKTIPVHSEFQIHGRPDKSGRGMPDSTGKYYVYEVHNIQYQIAEDYNGVFNGSDEYAAKAFGKDRTGALEYSKCHINKLNAPLVVTIDYGGFRVLAVSKLPTEKIQYSDEGEVRRITEDMVHGVQSKGENFINKNRILNTLMKGVALKLNLAEHYCKGIKDISATLTYGSSDIKVYRSEDEEFYMKDFWRAFPPEHPESTPHLSRAPRDQSIFWRMLRPEFCKYYKVPLSPDVGSLIVYKQSDEKTHDDNVREATDSLVKMTIPALLENLAKRTYMLPISEGLGLDISNELHSVGINIRHLGYMRSLLWRQLPGLVSIFFNEASIRTTRNLKDEVKNGETVKVNGINYIVTETAKKKVTEKRIPIKDFYLGANVPNVPGYAGSINNDNNNNELSIVFLCEMVARTMKALMRLQLRSYAKKNRSFSSQMIRVTACDYMNIITGASEKSNEFLQEIVFEGMRERFGVCAIRSSERYNFRNIIDPGIVYIVKRFQSMLGLQMSFTCLGDFNERPIGFTFSTLDILDAAPVIKHNIPTLSLAEANMVTMQAEESEVDTWWYQALSDKPVILYKCSERKANKKVENFGTLAAAFNGTYNAGCELEQPGPFSVDPFIRSVEFKPENHPAIECKYHPSIVPFSPDKHFTVECLVYCAGGADTHRVVLISGKYGLFASRDNFWTFCYSDGLDDVYIVIGPIDYENKRWVHLCISYDGSTVRCYLDSKLRTSIEVDIPIGQRRFAKQQELNAQLKEMKETEEKETAELEITTKQDAEAFFITKEGIKMLKNMAQSIGESREFQMQNFGADAADEQQSMKEKRLAAQKQAKELYIADRLVVNTKILNDKYNLMRTEINENIEKEREDGENKMRRPLRIGSQPGGKFGKSFFVGRMTCITIYDKAISADRVNKHYLAFAQDRTKDAQRLYAVAAAKFEEALVFAPDDIFVLKGYAKSLIKYLQVDKSSSTIHSTSKGKVKVSDSIEQFRKRHVPDGIAEILMALPREMAHAELFCEGFNAIMSIDPAYFTRNLSMTRKDLIKLPMLYGLDDWKNDEETIKTCANVFKEVLRDHELGYVYGETDLSWIIYVTCSELVVALVKYACENLNLQVVKVGEMFSLAGRDTAIPITDLDVMVLATNLVLSIGFDFSGCSLLTNAALSTLSRVKVVKILNIDGCVQINDAGMKYLAAACDVLEVLSMRNLINVTDAGIKLIAGPINQLRLLNVSHCPNISDDSLREIVKANHRLATIHLAGTRISDLGLDIMAKDFSKLCLTSLDLSFCRDITDNGVMSVVDRCPNLTFLNLCSCSRITDESTRAICSRLWKLETLNLEDVFLLNDASFWYDRTYDARTATDDFMLKALTTLNLKDCVNLTSKGLKGLASRCRKIETLILRGCDKINDDGLAEMTKKFMDNYPMCDAFKSIDLAYCTAISQAGILRLLPRCGILEELFLNGISSINDDFIHQVCMFVPTLQKLHVQRCVLLTDASLCSLADYLWIETLDITGCYKITDDGIEVFSSVCTGVIKLLAKKVTKLTSRSINCITRNCPVIRHLDIRDCPDIKEESIKDLQFKQPLCKIEKDNK